MRRSALVVALVAAVVAAACSHHGRLRTAQRSSTTTSVPTTSSSSSTTGAPTTVSTTTTTATTAAPTTRTTAKPTTTAATVPTARAITLTLIAKVTQPTSVAVRPGETALYITEKTGKVRRIANGQLQPGAVADLSGQLSSGSEQGLLGLAWSPDGRFLYVHYTDPAGDIHVVELDPASGPAPVKSGRTLFVQAHHTFANHNGGQLAFGPDGKLYDSLGDGGSHGDPNGNAQNLGTLLGKILRLDPRPSGGAPYGIPADNPFVHTSGARGEIWDYGLRNPWRFSFDLANGDLWIGDVGQDAFEEIDHTAAGRGGVNFGWNLREGTHPFNGGAEPPGAVDPVYDYSHAGGACSITGGYVYRGRPLANLIGGQYVFGDFCKGELMAFANGRARGLGLHVDQLSSFGQDGNGAIYALSLSGGVYRLDPIR